MPRIRGKRVVVWLIGSILFVLCALYIFRSFHWASIAVILRRTDLAKLILGCGISILAYWALRTSRWYILLRRMGVSIRPVSLYICTAITVGLSSFTPFRSGEIFRTEFLKSYGLLERAPGYGSFIIERFIDIIIVAGIAGLCVFFGLSIGLNTAAAYMGIASIIVFAVLAMFVVTKIKSRGTIVNYLAALKACSNDPLTLIVVFINSLASWAMIILGWQIALSSLSICLSFSKTAAIVSIVTIASLLSFIPGGIGVSEVGITGFLMHYKFSPSEAQAGALVLRAYGLLTVALSLVHLIIWKWLAHNPVMDARSSEL